MLACHIQVYQAHKLHDSELLYKDGCLYGFQGEGGVF